MKMMKLRNINKSVKLAASIIAMAFAQVASAQVPTAPAQGFNVFVNGGASFYTSETEGPVAIGGDLTIGGSYGVSVHNNFSYQLNKINIGLLVAGKVNYSGGNSLQVLNNGYVLIGNQNGSKAWYADQNNASSPIRITPGNDYNGSPNIALSASAPNLGVSASVNPIFQASPIDFGAAFTTLKSTSTSLSTATDNAVIYNSPNQGSVAIAHSGISSNSQIYITALKTGTTYLNVSGADLNNFQSVTFNGQKPDATHLLVININAPGAFTWNAYTNGGISGSNTAYILYNFYNTTTLNIAGNGSVEGTVFAPFANISKSSNNSNIEGQVIAQSYAQTAGGEIHSYNFNSTIDIPVVNTIPTVSATNFVFTSTDVTSLSTSWTIGNGTNRVVIASTSPITAFSSSSSLLSSVATASSVYGKGAALGGGYVVYNGTGNAVTVSGLTANTKYYFAVVEYNASSPYNATLSSYLTASASTLADTDGDGVADIYDAYPKDATRAFNTSFPATGFGTYLFEDNWPSNGDYDFNDLVMGYKYVTVTNAANQVVELKATLVATAAGALYKNAFGIQLDGLSPSLVTSVTGTDTKAASWLSTNANGTEAKQTYANVIVVDDISRVLPTKDGNPIVNTIIGAPYVAPDTINVVVTFTPNKVLQSDIAINPYLIVNQYREREIHMANKVPTSIAAPGYFGLNDDKSVPASGIYYVNKSNLPWALDIPAAIPYAIERVNVTAAYLNLANWAQSSGTNFTDWYLNNSGNRNADNLYKH